MEDVLLILAVDEDHSLGKPALESVTAARDLVDSLGAALVIGFIGGNASEAGAAIADCGAKRFLAVSGPEFSQSRYGTDAAAVEALSRAARANLVLAAGIARWNRIMPGVAHRLGGRADLHLTKVMVIDGAVYATKWFYRQRMEAVFARDQRPWFLVIDPGSYPPWQGSTGAASVGLVPVNVKRDQVRTQVQGLQAPPADEQTIRPEAELLFVAGAGWTKKQADGQTHPDKAAELILEFLRLSKASLGGSKSMVDLSAEGQLVLPFMSHLNQVGQTGATPRHPKGLATCCHGEEPHVVGWRFINERRAVNLDPNCGWAHGKTDVLYVADAFAVMERLNSLLKTS